MKAVQWSDVITRLAYHRNRLDLTKFEMRHYISKKYKCKFAQLTDAQIIELGITLKNATNKLEFIK